MLVKGVNDNEKCLNEIAEFINGIKAEISYISIPTRPPAKKYVLPPQEDKINLAYQIFSKKLEHVEYLIGYEGNEFDITGELKEGVLSNPSFA